MRWGCRTRNLRRSRIRGIRILRGRWCSRRPVGGLALTTGRGGWWRRLWRISCPKVSRPVRRRRSLKLVLVSSKMFRLTIRRLVAGEVTWRARGGVQAWRRLRPSHVGRETTRLLRLLWRRSQVGLALIVACHDATEQIARPVTDGRGWWLRGAMVLGILARTTASLEFAL